LSRARLFDLKEQRILCAGHVACARSGNLFKTPPFALLNGHHILDIDVCVPYLRASAYRDAEAYVVWVGKALLTEAGLGLALHFGPFS
jgi:hypothetical protein